MIESLFSDDKWIVNVIKNFQIRHALSSMPLYRTGKLYLAFDNSIVRS